jgi:WD40 repeat protein
VNSDAWVEIGASAMVLGKRKIVAASLLLLGVVGSGILPWASRAQEKPPTDQAGPPKPEADRPARLDVYGDPLPPGAIARMGTVRLRHSGSVTCVTFSPDGRLLASASAKGEMRLWDAATGKLIRAFIDPSDSPVRVMAFSPDGTLLASDKGRVVLWEVATGKRLRELEDCIFAQVTSLAFAPDSKTIALGTDDESNLWLFETATGNRIRNDIRKHRGAIQVAVFSPDGKTIATGSKDGTTRIWNAATGAELHRFPDLNDWALRRMLVVNEVEDVTFSPDGTLLATRTRDAIRLWEIAAGKEIRQLQQESTKIRSLAFSPDGKTLAASGILWDVGTGNKIGECEGGRGASLAFAPDGKTLATGGFDGIIRLHEADTGKERLLTQVRPNQGTLKEAAFTADGQTLATLDETGIRLWEVTSGKEIRLIDKRYCHALTLSPDGKLVAALDGAWASSAMVYIWDVATGKELHRVQDPSPGGLEAFSLAFASDGRTLAFARSDLTIHLMDLATGMELRQFIGHSGAVYFLSFGSDNRTLISTGSDDETRFWDVDTGQERRLPLEQRGVVRAISPDGQWRVVTHVEGRKDNSVQLCDAATGKGFRYFHDVFPYLAISPDGKTLALCARHLFHPDRDETIQLIEVASGKVRHSLTGYHGLEARTTFSSDGRMLASVSADTTALVWDVTGRAIEGKLPAIDLTPEQAESLWTDMAGEDAAKAYRAIWTLVAARQTLLLLQERLRPVDSITDDKQISQWVADLDSDEFTVREKAEEELRKAGDLAEPLLRRTLDGQPSPEVRRRVERLLSVVNEPSPERLRVLRATEVLEQISSPEARDRLQTLARGAPTAHLTREAKASLKRLAKRPLR